MGYFGACKGAELIDNKHTDTKRASRIFSLNFKFHLSAFLPWLTKWSDSDYLFEAFVKDTSKSIQILL